MTAMFDPAQALGDVMNRVLRAAAYWQSGQADKCRDEINAARDDLAFITRKLKSDRRGRP